MNTSRAACGRSVRATPVFVVCGSRMINSSPCKCGCESRPSWRSVGIRTTFSGEPMDQSALTDTSRLTATTWDRKRGRGGQFSGITLHRNLAPRFKALGNFSSMALGGALGNTRALTFLALKVLRWVANWGRTAVAEAMACMVFERRGSVERFVCCYGRSARARGVFTHHRPQRPRSLYQARLPFVDADSVISFAHVSRERQLAWRRESPKTWAPNGTGESQGLMTPDSRGRFVTIRASFRGF